MSCLEEPPHKRLRVHDYSTARQTDSHGGVVVSHSVAQGESRVQYGNIYNYATSSGTPERPASSDMAALLESLHFTQMDDRHESIKRAHGDTCRWILGRPEYTCWRNRKMLREHNGFLWIKSKPGAGKSTMMKFLVQSADKQLMGETIISFFFNARGERLERSLEGLYRGSLVQLLTKLPQIKDRINLSQFGKLTREDWPLETLKSIFYNAIMSLADQRMTCFVDALDECPESEIRDMIEFFEELGESAIAGNVHFQVCLSSRHYPHITIEKCQHFVLDGQEGHQADVAKYVKSKLKVRRGKAADELRAAVLEKAQGVFMWVVLVVRMLNQESDRGSHISHLRSRLKQIPGGLHDLLEDILKRGMQDNKNLVPMLQWIPFAQRPLSREELYLAVRTEQPDFVFALWDPEECDAETLDLFILDSSKGLAETTKGKQPKVQFIHESVRDYLRENGFKSLDGNLASNLVGLTHDYMKRCCLRWCSNTVLGLLDLPETLPKVTTEQAKQLRDATSQSFPFLKYSVDHMIYHADLACANGVAQTDLLEDYPWTAWARVRDLFAQRASDRTSHFETLESTLLGHDASHIFNVSHPYRLTLKTDQSDWAPQRALTAGKMANVATLGDKAPRWSSGVVRRVANTSEERIRSNNIRALELILSLNHYKPYYEDWNEFWNEACDTGRADIVQLVIDSGSIVGPRRVDMQHHLLSVAIKDITLLRTVLQRELVDKDLTGNGAIYFLFAWRFERGDAVRILLEHGAKADMTWDAFVELLSEVYQTGDTKLAYMLEAESTDINSQATTLAPELLTRWISGGGKLLHHEMLLSATRNGDEESVRLNLALIRIAFPSSRDPLLGDAIQLATIRRRYNILQMLLDSNGPELALQHHKLLALVRATGDRRLVNIWEGAGFTLPA